MAAIIRIKGDLATFDRRNGEWTSDYEPLEWRANSLMEIREPLVSHLKEHLDFERTAAEYIIECCGEGEIVHIDP